MPITIQAMDRMGVDGRVSRFVIPIGATINMDGTALYEAVAAIFIAQIRNIPLSFGHIVAVRYVLLFSSLNASKIIVGRINVQEKWVDTRQIGPRYRITIRMVFINKLLNNQ